MVNTDLSDDSCVITDIGPLLIDQPSLGGSDFTIRRDIAWTQDPNTVCVFDYFQRLALGAGAEYSGSRTCRPTSAWTTARRPCRCRSGAILPQQLSKTMTATQGSTYNWTVNKNANPSEVDFADTCLQSTEPRTDDVTITVNWTRSAKRRPVTRC